MKVPILLICWRRPSTTLHVLKRILAYEPSCLYVACDGARESHSEERLLVDRTRELVSTSLPARQFAKFRYSSSNKGCRQGVLEALNWFFGHEEEGIILEDDCLPSSTFFAYCTTLLEHYRNEDRVWQICGFNRLGRAVSHPHADYFFSRYGPIWGWASWRRAWRQHRDSTDWLTLFGDQKRASLYYPYSPERQAKLRIAARLQRGELDTWDYQWGFTKTAYSALSIVPSVNLIQNIGFGEGATHSSGPHDSLPEVGNLQHPLRHPPTVDSDQAFDRLYARSAFPRPSLPSRLKQWIRQIR